MTTPTPVTALARRWRLELDVSATEVPDWQLCPGVVDFSWTADPNIEDSSEYEDGGWAGNTKTGQAFEIVCKFNRKATADSTAYSPVHERLRVAAFAWGEASKIPVRWYDRTGLPEAYSGTVLVTWTPQGGEYTALDQVEVTLTGTGPLTEIANPAAA